jgi:hypothetical protein
MAAAAAASAAGGNGNPAKRQTPLALILEPSRELAEQTHAQITAFKKYLPLPGVREVLGADIWRRVCGFRQQQRRQQQQHARRRQKQQQQVHREQHRNRDWSESLEWMWTEPESVILLIIAAFALLVAFDSLHD